MRRRSFIFGIAASAACSATWPFAARAQQLATALARAKRDYGKIPHPSEAARLAYITRLIRLREKAASLNEWQPFDDDIKLHPAPSDSDGKSLSSLRVGEWTSPRHSYLYRADGTWTMLPEEEGTTHGTWRIEGNQNVETVATDPPQTWQATIILITKADFVFMDQTNIFYETRSS